MQPQTDPFSDETLSSLQALALPIEPVLRDAFLRAVAIELGRYQAAELGPGLIHRVGRELQREFLRPPARIARGVEKYG